MNARAQAPRPDDAQESAAVNDLLASSDALARQLTDSDGALDCEWLVFAAAVFGHAPTVSPSDLTFPYSELLARFREEGLCGLVGRPVAQEALFRLDESHPGYPDALGRALQAVATRNERHRLTLRLRLLLAETQRALVDLSRLPPPARSAPTPLTSSGRPR